MKSGAQLVWKNWNGVKVYTVNARNVEWIEIERFPESQNIVSLRESIEKLEEDLETDDNDVEKRNQLVQLKRDLAVALKTQTVKIQPSKSTAKITVDLLDCGTAEIIKGVKILQFPLNMNDATTGHKLQGMSKNKLVIVDWDLKFANWIYVVLSRVRTLQGLYLLKPLKKEWLDKFQVPDDLRRFENVMRGLQQHFLAERSMKLAEFDAQYNPETV